MKPTKTKEYREYSISRKIKQYDLPELLERIPVSENFVKVKYNDGTEDLVDPLSEFYLCKKYFEYFVDNYGYFLDAANKKVSGLKLFDFQKKLIVPSFLYKQYVIFKKCLTENNYVQTDRGFISIKDVEIGDKILTIDNEYKWDEVTDKWESSEKETVKIMLNNGTSIESTLNHRWMTNRGWVETKELTIEDELITDFGKNNFGDFELESDEHAKLIGYLMTDGRDGTAFINTNEKYINEALEAGLVFGDIKPYVKKRNRYQDHHLQSYSVKFTSRKRGTNKKNSFLLFAERFNLRKKSWDKKFTDELMKLNKRQMSILLNRLYAGDGWAGTKDRYSYSKNKKLNSVQSNIGFVTPCKDMAYQLQEILRRYGISSYIKIRKAGRKRATMDTYLVHIAQYESILKFIEEIGIFGKIDDSFVEKVKSGNKNTKHQNLNKIKKIVNIGPQKVYDITTKSTHTFLANGVKSHNCRQVGASVMAGQYAIWLANFNIAQDILIISKTRPDAQDFKSKSTITYENLPSFLKTKPTRDGQNMTTLKLMNKSRIVTKAQSPDAGRGGTWSLVILDEAAFMPFADEIWSSVYPALSVSNGKCFIISTSNGVGNFYHKMWIGAENRENDFHPIYIPWWKFPNRSNPWLEKVEAEDYRWIEEQLGEERCKEIKVSITKKLLKSNSEKKFEKTYKELLIETYTKEREEEQLAYEGPQEDKPWVKKMRDNAESYRKFSQETLAEFLGSGNTVISPSIIKQMEEGQKDPLFIDCLYEDGDPLPGIRVIEEPIPGLNYTATADVATGAGIDYSTIIVFRDDTLEQVAEYKRQLDTKEFGSNIKTVCRHYNNAFVIIETNAGQSVFNEVFLHDTDPYHNVFFEMKNKTYRGLHTGPANKKLMIDEFISCIERQYIKIYGKRTIEEIKVFIWHNGKPQASRGYNDDLVLCIMFLAYFIKYGGQKNKALGFATADQSMGYDPDSEMLAEIEAMQLETKAKEAVEEMHGIDWETYNWLLH